MSKVTFLGKNLVACGWDYEDETALLPDRVPVLHKVL